MKKTKTERELLAERLREYKLARKWGHEQLAAAVGLSPRTIKRALSGNGYLGAQAIYDIEKLIGKAEAA